MSAKSNRFGDSNNQCKIALMSTTTTMNTLGNQQHQQLSGEQQKKDACSGTQQVQPVPTN
jgi:hypothetical protein